MASRRVALVGCNQQGPAIAIKGVLEPLLRVRGVREGVRVRLLLLDGTKEPPVQYDFYGPGDYPIAESLWAIVSCEQPDKQTICEVISTKVA